MCINCGSKFRSPEKGFERSERALNLGAAPRKNMFMNLVLYTFIYEEIHIYIYLYMTCDCPLIHSILFALRGIVFGRASAVWFLCIAMREFLRSLQFVFKCIFCRFLSFFCVIRSVVFAGRIFGGLSLMNSLRCWECIMYFVYVCCSYMCFLYVRDWQCPLNSRGYKIFVCDESTGDPWAVLMYGEYGAVFHNAHDTNEFFGFHSSFFCCWWIVDLWAGRLVCAFGWTKECGVWTADFHAVNPCIKTQPACINEEFNGLTILGKMSFNERIIEVKIRWKENFIKLFLNL